MVCAAEDGVTQLGGHDNGVFCPLAFSWQVMGNVLYGEPRTRRQKRSNGIRSTTVQEFFAGFMTAGFTTADN